MEKEEPGAGASNEGPAVIVVTRPHIELYAAQSTDTRAELVRAERRRFYRFGSWGSFGQDPFVIDDEGPFSPLELAFYDATDYEKAVRLVKRLEKDDPEVLKKHGAETPLRTLLHIVAHAMPVEGCDAAPHTEDDPDRSLRATILFQLALYLVETHPEMRAARDHWERLASRVAQRRGCKSEFVELLRQPRHAEISADGPSRCERVMLGLIEAALEAGITVNVALPHS